MEPSGIQLVAVADICENYQWSAHYRFVLKGYLTDFGCYKLSWCDGRCVQGPGTYSPRRADPRLLAIPTSCRRVAAYNPN